MPRPLPRPRSPDQLFSGGGELGARMAELDWTKTPLGPVEAWPQSLKTCVRIVLTSRQPMFVWWGEELINLYNDAYRSIVGGKHPAALAQPAHVVWKEIWDDVGPRARAAIQGNVGTYDEALQLIMERHGYPEETYYTFSYSPVPGDAGGTGGILCANTDDTQRIVGERQVATLRELAARAADARTWEDACRFAAEALATNDRDLPFAAIYALSEDRARARCAAATGIACGHPLVPQTLELADASLWPLGEAIRDGAALACERPGPPQGVPRGAWKVPPARVALVPFSPSGPTGRGGVLLVGLNPYRLFDDGYRGFLELVAGQISASVANAQAYEEEKRRAEALAEIDRAKTAFFSNVSHEFRTPLTLMLGPTEDALASKERSLHGAGLETVYRNELRLLRLVNALLDFARVEAGRIRAVFEPTDLGPLTSELASVFRPAIERAGLRFTVEVAPSLGAVLVDREMWEKIVLNLLSNALKFTFQGEIALSLRDAGGATVLTVRDTGGGVPPEELPRLFERFHRVEGVKARTHEGSGIGLALVSELVKLHGGTVEARSVPGEGTAFEVTLKKGQAHLAAERIGHRARPGASELREAFAQEALRWTGVDRLPDGVPPPPPPPQQPGAEAPDPGTRILVAGDNADMREYLTRLIGAQWTVEAVADGVEAVAAARARPPDLVLTDAMMPGLDGFGVLRELRSREETRAIPVIMLSARAGEETRLEGLEAGADDYLIKPFSARELLARVRTHLQLSRLGRAAQRAEAELRSVLLQAPVPIAVIAGPDLVFTLMNDRYAEVMGRQDATGLPLLEALPELAGQGVDDLIREVMQTGKAYVGKDVPMQLQRAGGAALTYWTLIYAPLLNAQGVADRVMAICQEVTEEVVARGRGEDALKNTERLHAALAAARVGTYSWDVRTDRVEHDAGLGAIFQFGPGEGDSVAAYGPRVHPDDRAQWLEAIERCRREGAHFDQQYRVVQPDGTVLWVRDRGTMTRDASGQALHLAGAVIDLSEVKRLQERAEEASRAKDEFLAMLGHELRNPLSPIVTALQLMKLRSDGRVSKEQTVIERQVRHLVRLVDDLLDVARITRGKIELRKEVVSISEVIAKAIEIASPLLEQRNHDLQVHARETLRVEGDPVRLAQVLSNLLTNAARYTEPGGHIDVTAARDGAEVVIRVRDDGIGIGPEFLPKIFDLFVQGPRAVDRAGGGLGLGLALVRSLVKMHGGTVTAHSEGRGRGSELVVRLPALGGLETRAEPPRPAEKLRKQKDGAPPLRVLVVDDNTDAAESLGEMLRELGDEVAVAHDGAEALTVAARFRPHVAVLDIGLPVMDGYELAGRLRALPQTSATRLIALTGYGQERDHERSRRAGFDAHMVKPVDFDVLLRAVRVDADAGNPC